MSAIAALAALVALSAQGGVGGDRHISGLKGQIRATIYLTQ